MATENSRPTFLAGVSRTTLSAVALLMLSWIALFWCVAMETSLLVPYDTSWYDYWGWPEGGPAPGSWQRELNYFLESPIGSILPAMLVVGINALVLGVALYRISQTNEELFPLLLGFAASNLISVPIILSVSCVQVMLAGGLTGWRDVMAAWVPIFLLLILLFALQTQVLPQKLGYKLHSGATPHT